MQLMHIAHTTHTHAMLKMNCQREQCMLIQKIAANKWRLFFFFSSVYDYSSEKTGQATRLFICKHCV